MGGPKALLLLHGVPLALAHARRAMEAGCAQVILVTSADVAGRLGGAPDLAVAISGAPDPAGSLAVGVALLDPRVSEVLVTPVDAPPPSIETLGALFDALARGARAATPSHRGRGGHPVVCAADVLRSLAAAPRPLRDVLRALGDARVRVPVDDPAVTLDLDTPDDFRAFSGESPRFLK